MKELTQHQRNRTWFIIFSAAFAFGIVWTMLGESMGKVIYTTIAFALFLHSGVTMDIYAHHAEHEADGHG